MAQTPEGATKIAAKKRGISVEEYLAHKEQGEKWCYKCQSWKSISSFSLDRSRTDQHKAFCLECTRVKELRPRENFIPSMKGRHYGKEVRSHMGRKPGFVSPRKGIPRTKDERAKISASVFASEKTMRGERHHSFIDGHAERRHNMRRTSEYAQWRLSVFERDAFTCQHCGDKRGGNLVAHHVKPFARYPDLRYDIDNGIALCDKCHRKVHYKPDSLRNIQKRRSTSYGKNNNRLDSNTHR